MSKNENVQKFWSSKRIFYVPKFTTKTICSLGLLIAITVVLSMISGNLRFGPYSKLTISFISVFIVAYYYGGLASGLVAVLADLISFSVTGGTLIIQFTIIEFALGFLFGLLFYKTNINSYLQKLLIFIMIQFVINIFLKTYIFSMISNNNFIVLFVSRILVCLVQVVVTFTVLTLIKPYLKNFEKIIK